MEIAAREAEQSSDYKMNNEVESDTEEWRVRKHSTTSKNQQNLSKLRIKCFAFLAF